ncbi:MAG TPA: serine hydrolase domain-containing protein [Candidatus Limnocylindrales bacterium]|nr:serine hydrolase domain-containing protein [Candidatus Limnocylindrales bacterium]
MSTDARELGFDPERLERLRRTINADIDAERYDGCVVLVARGGHVAMHEAFGFADRASGRHARTDDVFFSMSIAKQLTNAVVMMRVERGDIALTTAVADVIPEFGVLGKQHVTIGDLIIHKAGLPLGMPPMAPEDFGSIEAVTMATARVLPDATPGTRVSYAAVVAHAVLAQVVCKLEGCRRPFRRVVAEDLLEPLGMKDTSLGARPDLAPRRVPVVVRDRTTDMFDADLLEGVAAMMDEKFEMPAGGFLTTAHDFYRFAECFRRGGELDGKRLLSPSTIRLMTTNQTGDLPNSLWDFARTMLGWPLFPAYLGYGFFVRGEGAYFPTPFGLMSSPSTFGGFGAGSNCFWIDPERDLIYVFLSAGLMRETKSTPRHQRLSDLVQAALVG